MYFFVIQDFSYLYNQNIALQAYQKKYYATVSKHITGFADIRDNTYNVFVSLFDFFYRFD